MRGLLTIAAMVGLVGVAHAEALKARPLVTSRCEVTAAKLAQNLGPDAKAAITQRCNKDSWSSDTQQCFAAAPQGAIAATCLDTLSRKQRTALEGDADRLADPRLGRWLSGRGLMRAPVVTLASFDVSADRSKLRALHLEGMTAYKAGNYNGAVAKFAEAIDMGASPEVLYQAAQAYRLKGERAKALELYERYLEVAPDGAAAAVCRWHVERMTATP